MLLQAGNAENLGEQGFHPRLQPLQVCVSDLVMLSCLTACDAVRRIEMALRRCDPLCCLRQICRKTPQHLYLDLLPHFLGRPRNLT